MAFLVTMGWLLAISRGVLVCPIIDTKRGLPLDDKSYSLFFEHSSSHSDSIPAFIDGSKSDTGVGFGIIFLLFQSEYSSDFYLTGFYCRAICDRHNYTDYFRWRECPAIRRCSGFLYKQIANCCIQRSAHTTGLLSVDDRVVLKQGDKV